MSENINNYFTCTSIKFPLEALLLSQPLKPEVLTEHPPPHTQKKKKTKQNKTKTTHKPKPREGSE